MPSKHDVLDAMHSWLWDEKHGQNTPFPRSLAPALDTLSRPLYLVSFLLAIYNLFRIIHRLYLSPVAKFPGPRLAAATFWYEFYYDVIKRGRYTWKIAELHKQYGRPIFAF